MVLIQIIYPPPHEDFALICNALFYERPRGNKDHPNAYLCYMLYCLSIRKPFNLAYYIAKRMESVTKSDIMALPYGMLLTRGNKDHPNAYLCYMLYCLSIRKPFNLAYYIAKRMESVTKSDIMALPYVMLLTHLFEHVRTSRPFAITDDHYLVDHVMITLSEKSEFLR
ncbi:hypothetical protein Tco_1043671 [Tanacetum coccineum]|uniref:Pentatricopeptide repeat-containing protein n=1 Tax=Tanacetum coccineum TaxID=301880 RepID=A0ABQ5GNY8_9ASTR